jgi:hypothetical protein
MQKTISYRQFIAELINLLCQFLKFEKESKMLKLIEELAYDKKPFYDEIAYLQIFALFNAVRKKFPNNFEKIIEDLKKAIFELLDTSFQDLRAKLESELKLNERILDYMQTWNETLERARKINDDSQLNNPAYTISKKAAINAYGEEKGMDIRVVMAFTPMFMGPFEAFGDYLKECNVV